MQNLDNDDDEVNPLRRTQTIVPHKRGLAVNAFRGVSEHRPRGMVYLLSAVAAKGGEDISQVAPGGTSTPRFGK